MGLHQINNRLHKAGFARNPNPDSEFIRLWKKRRPSRILSVPDKPTPGGRHEFIYTEVLDKDHELFELF